jgi:hypothetical protein
MSKKSEAASATPKSKLLSIALFGGLVALAAIVHAVGSVSQVVFVYGGL